MQLGGFSKASSLDYMYAAYGIKIKTRAIYSELSMGRYGNGIVFQIHREQHVDIVLILFGRL